jgi:two-component system, NarL family, response regulator NreC
MSSNSGCTPLSYQDGSRRVGSAGIAEPSRWDFTLLEIAGRLKYHFLKLVSIYRRRRIRTQIQCTRSPVVSECVRILIADDHTIVRHGLTRLIDEQPDLKVIGEATNGHMAVEKATELKPDIIIMDIAMPRMNGIEAAKRIRKQSPKTKILILSMYSHEHYIHELLETGVSGYLLKDASGRDIITAIRSAMRNETFLSPTISTMLVETYLSPNRKCSSIAERYNQLSNREREVFQLIGEGHSTRDIADMLCVSISTIKSHRSKIMEKLNIDSPVKLIHFAIQLGLVDPSL